MEWSRLNRFQLNTDKCKELRVSFAKNKPDLPPLMACGNALEVVDSAKLSGEQGWRSGESARLPPMCPGFDSRTRRHMWVEFVGSLLCSERFFSGYSGFPLSSKTNI